MKKLIAFILIIIFSPFLIYSQIDTTQYLIDLRIRAMVNERQKLYSQYSKQIEKKSGIFGNQTKKDVRAANEILLKILATDSRIFSELEEMIKAQDREVERSKFEKQDKEYKIIKKEEEVQTHSETVAKLQRNVETLSSQQIKLKRTAKIYKFLFFSSLLFLIISTGGIGYLAYRKYHSFLSNSRKAK